MKLFASVLLCFLSFCCCSCLATLDVPAYPSFDSGLCTVSKRAEEGIRKKLILDISHSLRPDLPAFMTDGGIGTVLELVASQRNGSLANESRINKLGAHSGTHVDAPSHIFQEYYDAGDHIDTLDLHILNGLTLVVDVPRDTNITAQAMEGLHIPRGVERVLFRTLNTDRRLMWKTQFDSSYVGFTEDGAQWLKDNTDVKLIGVDYLSVASFDYLIPAHVVFLQNKDTILVEGLNLDDVKVGLYELHCLPLKLVNSDGSPIRCILEK